MAIKSPNSSEWLFVLPVSAYGLRLSDEAIRIAVGLRLDLNLFEPHICPCGANVDARGLRGLSCKRSTGRSTRQQQLNDIIWRARKLADIPATKEPAGLVRVDGKRPDGLTLVPWQGERCLTWDATIVDTLAVSYVQTGSTASAGAANAAAANRVCCYVPYLAAARKHAKYDTISAIHIFVPVAVETLGLFCDEDLKFVSEIGLRLSTIFDDSRESSCVFQKVSVLIQRFNEVAFLEILQDIPDTEG